MPFGGIFGRTPCEQKWTKWFLDIFGLSNCLSKATDQIHPLSLLGLVDFVDSYGFLWLLWICISHWSVCMFLMYNLLDPLWIKWRSFISDQSKTLSMPKTLGWRATWNTRRLLAKGISFLSLEYHWNSESACDIATIFSQESEFWGIYRHVILPKRKLLARTPWKNLGQIIWVKLHMFSMPLCCTMLPWAPTSLLQEVVSLEHDISNTGASQPTGFVDLLLRSLLQVLRVHRGPTKTVAPVAQSFGPWVPQFCGFSMSQRQRWCFQSVRGIHGPIGGGGGTTMIPRYQQQILQIDGSRWFQSGGNLHRSRGFIQDQATQALGWRRAAHLHCKGGVLWNAVHSPTNVIFLAILLLLHVLSLGPAVLITLTLGCQAHQSGQKQATCRLRDAMSVASKFSQNGTNCASNWRTSASASSDNLKDGASPTKPRSWIRTWAMHSAWTQVSLPSLPW